MLGEVDQPETQVFVIGKEVDDFPVVNYNDLFSTGLAAVQELSKQSDALKAEKAEMKKDLAAGSCVCRQNDDNLDRRSP